MIHEHHEWLADLNKSIVESYEREQVEIAGKPERIQELGHRVDADLPERRWFFLSRRVTMRDTERCGFGQSPQRHADQPAAHQAS
jgi:hypothetical protein